MASNLSCIFHLIFENHLIPTIDSILPDKLQIRKIVQLGKMSKKTPIPRNKKPKIEWKRIIYYLFILIFLLLLPWFKSALYKWE